MFSEFSWWHVVYLLVVTHITIITVTVYLHRGLAHRSLEVKKPLEHFFRFKLANLDYIAATYCKYLYQYIPG